MSNLPVSEVAQLIITGSFSESTGISEVDIDKAVEVMKEASTLYPEKFLQIICDAVEIRMDNMVPVALAILTCKAPDAFLTRQKTVGKIISILHVYGPGKLLEYVEFIKSKSFGRGLGSRPQKWVRSVMETWDSESLQQYIQHNPKSLYALLRLIHPRYPKEKGKILASFLKSK